MRYDELLPGSPDAEIVGALESFRDALRNGEDLSSRFVVRYVNRSAAVFDHPESAELPDVVRRYHAARKAWLATLGTQAPQDVATAYATAINDLWAEVERRGGRWPVGRLVYRIGKRGLSIEQVVETEPVETSRVD